MCNMLDRRKQCTDNVTNRDVDEYMEGEELFRELEKARVEYEEFRKTVATTNAPLWGNIDVNKKHDNVLLFVSANMNGLAYWLHNNHKADRLKFIKTKLDINVVSLQEVCVKWAAFKASHNIGSLHRTGDE